MASMTGQDNRQDLRNDADNENDDGEEGERALLRTEVSQRYTLMQRPGEENTWIFVSGILLEVGSILYLFLKVFQSCVKDSSNIVINDYRNSIYRGTFPTNCCM